MDVHFFMFKHKPMYIRVHITCVLFILQCIHFVRLHTDFITVYSYLWMAEQKMIRTHVICTLGFFSYFDYNLANPNQIEKTESLNAAIIIDFKLWSTRDHEDLVIYW